MLHKSVFAPFWVPSPLLLPSWYHSPFTFLFLRAIFWKSQLSFKLDHSLKVYFLNLRGERSLQKSVTCLYVFDLQWPSERSLWIENSSSSFLWMPLPFNDPRIPTWSTCAAYYVHSPCRVLIRGENCDYRVPQETLGLWGCSVRTFITTSCPSIIIPVLSIHPHCYLFTTSHAFTFSSSDMSEWSPQVYFQSEWPL